MIEKVAMVILVFLVLINYLSPGMAVALSTLIVYLSLAKFNV